MPAADAVLLPLLAGLTLLGVIATGIAWRRGHRGRVVQGIGLALAPIALYLTGLLRILWDTVVALVGWAGRLIFSPVVWIGLVLLAICVVLWVVGGVLTRRSRVKPQVEETTTKAVAARSQPSRPGTSRTQPAGKQAPAEDDDMAEIEAILKSRGIE